MNRLQKKCFIVSVGVHVLLPLILLFGVGFFSPTQPNSPPINNFIAAATVDSLMSGGGDNTVKSPPALATAPPEPPQAQIAPTQPPPPPVAQPKQQPAPPIEKIESPAPRDIPKETKTAKSDAPAVDTKPRPHKIEVNTQLVTTTSTDAKAAQNAAKKAAAAAARRQAEAVSHALSGIRGGVADSTEVKLPGVGGGGIPYANFISAVTTVYYNAWHQPHGAPNVTAKVSVTIARDGTVLSARIVTPSGNSAVDNSVQETIDRVKFVAPLPESSSDDKREVPVNFTTQSNIIG